jgi:hypothetical protein
MKTLEEMETQLKQQDIAARVIHLWEELGHHHHRDLECWLEAEAELGAALTSHQIGESRSGAIEENSVLECDEEVLAPAW